MLRCFRWAGKIYGNWGPMTAGSQLTRSRVLDTTSGNSVRIGIAHFRWRRAHNAGAAAVLNHRLYVVAGSNGSAHLHLDLLSEQIVTGLSTNGRRGTAFDQSSTSCQQQCIARNHRGSVQADNFDGTSWGSASSTSLDATKVRGCGCIQQRAYHYGDNSRATTVPASIRKNSLASSHRALATGKTSGSLIYVAATASVRPARTLEPSPPYRSPGAVRVRTPLTRSIDQRVQHSAVARSDSQHPHLCDATATSQATNITNHRLFPYRGPKKNHYPSPSRHVTDKT